MNTRTGTYYCNRSDTKIMAELSIFNSGIRNPLMVILALTERECPDAFDEIERSVNYIDCTINLLDKRWDESNKIFSFLKNIMVLLFIGKMKKLKLFYFSGISNIYAFIALRDLTVFSLWCPSG